jgi:hypothetical protein
LFWEKSTAGWWLISQANKTHITPFVVSHRSLPIFCETWAIISWYLASCLILLSPSSQDSVAASVSIGFQIFNTQSLDPIPLRDKLRNGNPGWSLHRNVWDSKRTLPFFLSEKEMQGVRKAPIAATKTAVKSDTQRLKLGINKDFSSFPCTTQNIT